NGINVLAEKVDVPNADALKNLTFSLKDSIENSFILLVADLNGKPMISVILSDNLINERGLNAGKMVRELAKEVQGGGGGQAFYATAGGKNIEGLQRVLTKGIELIEHAQ